MSIEKRTSRRIPVNVPVGMRHKDSDVRAGRIMNICMDGMQVKANYDGIRRGAIVNVSFLLGDRTWQLRALVMYSQHGLYGLMFPFPQSELYAFAKSMSRETDR